MKKIYSFLVALFITQLLSAQSYIPFPSDSAQWNTVRTWYDGGQWGTYMAFNYQYRMEGDTVINGIAYNKMFTANEDNFIEYIGALREDSVKNIFFYPGQTVFNDVIIFPSDTTEYLLYTFNNLEVGTVFSMNGNDNITVLAIDSVLFGDNYHKRYYLNNTSMFAEYWIEGIGSDHELFSAFTSQFEWLLFTLCFKPDSVDTYYINSPDGGDWCEYYVGIDEPETERLSLFPNPVTDELNIPGSFKPDALFYILDAAGRVVLKGNYQERIKVAHLQPGAYSVVVSGDQKRHIAKFLKN